MSSLARVPQTPEEGGSAGAADLSWLVEIPEEIWHTCICTHLDSVTLSRLARTCVALHRHTTAYCGTILYGRRLVREGLHNLRDILIGFHAKCYTTRRGDCARGELDAKIDGHIHCLCENFNSARGGDKTPGGASAEARQKKTAVHNLHKALAGWSIEDIATFLLPLATHTGMDWKESSAAISWALRVLGYDTLHRVLYSPDPVLELQNNDNTSDQEAIASIVGAVVSRCGSGDDGLDTILAKALALIHGYEVKKGVKDLSSLEFALAGGGVAVSHYIKQYQAHLGRLPGESVAGRHSYISAIYRSFNVDNPKGWLIPWRTGSPPRHKHRYKHAEMPATMLLRRLGILSDAYDTSPILSFACTPPTHQSIHIFDIRLGAYVSRSTVL